ncbi:MAG: hypothetical protein ABSF91_03020 [Bacteroidota bacterium]|jgi:hypothetical protein
MKRSRHHKKWTSDEDRLLRESYGSTRRRFLAEQLKRSVLAISTRARQLRLTKKLRPWLAADDEVLTRLYGKESFESIAKQLGRSEVAVAGRTSKLGLRTRVFWTQVETRYLRRWYGKKSAVELARLMGRDVLSVRSKAKRLELTKRVPKKPWTAADLTFLRENIRTMSHKELAEKLNRTAWAIGQYASRSGLLKKQ